MSPAGAVWPVLLAGFLAKTTFVLTLALIAALAARRRPAAFRHFLFSAALISLLLLPLLTLAPIGWRSSLVPSWLDAPGLARADLSTGASGNVVNPETSSPGRTAGTLRKDGSAGGWPVHVEAVWPDAALDGGQTTAPFLTFVSPEPGSAQTASQGRTGPARPGAFGLVLAIVWSIGAAALMLRLFIGLAGAVRLTAEGTPLRDPAWRILLERFIALVSLRRQVRLRSHPAVLVPLTWGWRKPVVLMPDGADAWTDDERSSALFHELSHIKRADFLVMLLVRASLALFWWNPLCWIVYRELLKDQEIACDELVLRAGIRPSTYAASLLAFRRSAGFRWNPSAALLGMLGRSSFQERLAVILKQKLTFMEVRMRTKIILAVALVAAVALVGTARPAAGREAHGTPAPASFAAGLEAAAVAQTQAEKAAQEKEAEKTKAAEKAKAEEKAAKEKAAGQKTIVVKPVVVEGQPIEIVITEGDQVKKLRIDKPLTITKSKNGEAIVLTIEGQKAQVLEGEPLRLEIKGGEVTVLKEGHPVKIAEGQALKHSEATAFTVVTKDGGEGGNVVYYFTPRGEAGAEGKTFTLVKEADKGQAVWVSKSAAGEPAHVTWVARDGQAHAFSSTTDEEMLAKVQALQEQVQAIKAKKMDITALEESLKKLEAELRANEEKLKQFEVEVAHAPHQYVVTKKVGGHETGGNVAIWVTEKGHPVKVDEAKAVVRAAGDGDAAINVILTGKTGEEGKKAYERALVELKKRLPEGYKLAGQSYDPENGTMVFGIAVAEGMKTDETVVRKLVEALQAEIRK